MSLSFDSPVVIEGGLHMIVETQPVTNIQTTYNCIL
jgi:hypothetical protein